MMKTSRIARAGLIAAIYVVLTVLPAMIPALGTYLYGSVQFRISEMLCVLPFFFTESIYGLFIGCAIANYFGTMLGFTVPVDIVIGSLTTLAAAYVTSKIRIKWLVPLPTIIFNAVIIGLEITYLFSVKLPLWENACLVGLGELVVCYVLGLPLLLLLERRGFGKNGFLKTKNYNS